MFCKSISTEVRETNGSSVFIQNKYSPSSSLHVKRNYRKVYHSAEKQECVLEQASSWLVSMKILCNINFNNVLAWQSSSLSIPWKPVEAEASVHVISINSLSL